MSPTPSGRARFLPRPYLPPAELPDDEFERALDFARQKARSMRDLDREDVRVSPSRLQALEECQLDWVIGDLGADAGGAVAGLGTLVHAAMEHADGIDEAALWAEVERAIARPAPP